MEFRCLLDHDQLTDSYGDDDRKLLGKLVEAAIQGSIPLLSQTLEQNPHLLRSTVFPTPGSPLHVSALLGHVELTRHLLRASPGLSRSLDPRGATPLHLASAKGNAEIARELVSSDPSTCCALDRGGWTPIHAAAAKGRTEVLRELLEANPNAAAAMTAGGESCLHLSVKHNRIEAMKAILKHTNDDDHRHRLINRKDTEGNSVLHLAVARKQIEIIKLLLDTTTIQTDTTNSNGLTAFVLLLQSPRDLRDLEIKDSLKLRSSPPSKPKHTKHRDWLAKKRSSLMIVSSLLATVAFQAGLSPPGGVWQSDFSGNPNGTHRVDRPHKAGQSVMAYTLPSKYGQYMIFNTVAFLASLSIIMLQVSGLPMRQRRWMWIQMAIVWSAITAQTLTYFVTLISMTPKHVENSMYLVAEVCVMMWLILIGTVFIGNAAPVVVYLLRKYGYIEVNEEASRVYEEDVEDDDDAI